MGTASKDGGLTELRAAYLWAARHHKARALHAIAHALHAATGAHCVWERHIDGGHTA